MVVVMTIEPGIEPYFHEDSYAYRPNRSALDAVRKAKERSYTFHWVLDLDIKGFFDNIDHELLIKALERHVKMQVGNPLYQTLVVRSLSVKGRNAERKD